MYFHKSRKNPRFNFTLALRNSWLLYSHAGIYKIQLEASNSVFAFYAPYGMVFKSIHASVFYN